jgi:4a-hydroxytetrahydrobiopterin dehydratase
MSTVLNAEERAAFAASHPRWSLDAETATRTFVFSDFVEAMGFVTRVALAAERADHHPDIDIRWNRVTLATTTHSAGGFTDRDVALVAAIDGWVGPD